MNKKQCVITGGYAGIGFQTAIQLAEKDFGVIILGRDDQKGNDAVTQIIQKTSNNEVRFIQCDLSSQQSTQEAAHSIMDIQPDLDVLINNAGTWYSKLTYTEDGIEMMFAVNHLAYFLLSHLLLPLLANNRAGRIINVGSDSHFQGRMHFDDLFLKKKYHGLKAYAQSKLANLLFTYELDRELKKRGIPVLVNCVQPGLVKTDIGVKNTVSLHSIAWKIRRLGGVSSEEGAKTSVYLASSEDVEGISGKYWDKCKPKRSSKRSHNEKDAVELWNRSMEFCSIIDYFLEE
jgi:NAD(P)-dependent dehydrogenase (short-subunit alcohol dehydrogenase family)